MSDVTVAEPDGRLPEPVDEFTQPNEGLKKKRKEKTNQVAEPDGCGTLRYLIKSNLIKFDNCNEWVGGW